VIQKRKLRLVVRSKVLARATTQTWRGTGGQETGRKGGGKCTGGERRGGGKRDSQAGGKGEKYM